MREREIERADLANIADKIYDIHLALITAVSKLNANDIETNAKVLRATEGTGPSRGRPLNRINL